jgi:hypothetical protein
MGKVGLLRNPQNHEIEYRRQYESSLSMEHGEHHQWNRYQLQGMDLVEDWTIDLPTAKTSRVEPKECMGALTQPDLEIDVEEAGVEYRNHTTIVKFFRKAMGICDFQLIA